mmetsp:Transcript_44820/g.105511  ORF Transcript_44820/g.105511 Transcript_44820/m.105511 type:complete len:212 (-) Transcript_44820:915-1550(-)
MRVMLVHLLPSLSKMQNGDCEGVHLNQTPVCARSTTGGTTSRRRVMMIWRMMATPNWATTRRGLSPKSHRWRSSSLRRRNASEPLQLVDVPNAISPLEGNLVPARANLVPLAHGCRHALQMASTMHMSSKSTSRKHALHSKWRRAGSGNRSSRRRRRSEMQPQNSPQRRPSERRPTSPVSRSSLRSSCTGGVASPAFSAHSTRRARRTPTS